MRNAIRTAIPAVAVAAIAIGIALPAPHELPALALGSRELLWLERTLVLFYGFLLLFVPILRALQGELPIELSARGRATRKPRMQRSRSSRLASMRTRRYSMTRFSPSKRSRRA